MSVRKIVPAFLLLVASLRCAAQEDITDSRRNAIVRAIEKAAPATVSINVVRVEAERIIDPFFRDFWDLFDFPGQYRVRERRVDSVGSGFIFDAQGHILTNYHVIEDADSVASVTLADGREVPVDLVGVDARTDVAILRARSTGLPYVTFGDSDKLITGEWVIAIGNPFGTLMGDPQPTVSVGVVSASHRRISPRVGGGERLYQGMIQTDAAINPGNSGGPLVNAAAQVVGVNTMIFSPSGGSIGLGFAIPINRARRVAQEIIRYGRRRDPWLGFKVEDVRTLDERLRGQLGIRARTGCIVTAVLEKAPAYKAGLRPGNVITAVNNEPMHTCADLDFAIWGLFVGDTVTLQVDREGALTTLTFPVQELRE